MIAKRRIFNAIYFLVSLAVFGWMLRDNPHIRIVPVTCLLLSGFYGFLFVVSLVKPNGFAVTHEVLPMRKQRCLRRWALLMPIPAMLYFMAYSACMDYAGEWRCLNKFFNPIAKFEKAAFSRNRMVYFVSSTHPRLLAAGERNELRQKWRAAESYYKAATNLENRLFDKKMPSSYTIMACLYDKMGRHDKAERLYLRAEELANEQCSSEDRICAHSEIVSIPHVIRELQLAGLSEDEVGRLYPWLNEYRSLHEAPASILGRQFAWFNLHSNHRHDWCKHSACRGHLNCKDESCHQNALKCNDEDCQQHHHALNCKDEDCDQHALNCNDKDCDKHPDCKDKDCDHHKYCKDLNCNHDHSVTVRFL